ncbi:hypothetical protein, partial [Piscibacillus halophilus]|uniref:hypothetical protein n=1 Tax=Piscibacillus halophilus TaxID=571933 RepID=UPI00158C74C4
MRKTFILFLVLLLCSVSFNTVHAGVNRGSDYDTFVVNVPEGGVMVPFYLGVDIGLGVNVENDGSGYKISRNDIWGWLNNYCQLPFNASFSTGHIEYTISNGNTFTITPNQYYDVLEPACSYSSSRESYPNRSIGLNRYGYSARGTGLYSGSSYPSTYIVDAQIGSITFSSLDNDISSVNNYEVLLQKVDNAFQTIDLDGSEKDLNTFEIGVEEYTLNNTYKFSQNIFNMLINGEKISDEKIEENFLKEKALLSVAKKKHIVSEQEASNYANNIRKKLEEEVDEPTVKISNKILNNLRSEYGWSEDKLWNELEKSYQNLLTIGQYKKDFLSSLNIPSTVQNKQQYL